MTGAGVALEARLRRLERLTSGDRLVMARLSDCELVGWAVVAPDVRVAALLVRLDPERAASLMLALGQRRTLAVIDAMTSEQADTFAETVYILDPELRGKTEAQLCDLARARRGDAGQWADSLGLPR